MPTDTLASIRLRPFRDADDYAVMASLISTANLADGIDDIPTAASLRADYQARSEMDPARDVVFAEVGDGVVGFGEAYRQVRDGVAIYWTLGAVLPAYRGRGIGRAILAANERRGREIAAAHDDPGGRAFASWASEREGGADGLLRSAGYAPARYGFAMVRSTIDGLAEAALPPGLEIRPVNAAHARTIFEADNDAFRDHWGHHEATEDDFAATYASPDLDTSLWRIAWDGDEVAGGVLTWIYASENEAFGVRRGWLEHIFVRRPWRKRGLATALIASALAALRERGMTEAMLGVDADNLTGALRLYERLGFTVKDRATHYRKPF